MNHLYPVFRAEIVQADHGRDLALLQIRQDLDGRSLDPRTLTLPYVELGDSDETQLDETIFVLGYEGIGDAPIQSVDGPLRGTISGFLAEPSGGDRAWLKTDVPIPGMMSGGGAYDLAGRLVGVPTSSPLITGGSGECVALRDSNNDGFVDGADRCIPLGANSNALRPVNMVRPLLRAATLGLTAEDLPRERKSVWTGFQRFTFVFRRQCARWPAKHCHRQAARQPHQPLPILRLLRNETGNSL